MSSSGVASTYEFITLETLAGGVGLITLNRPDRLNAWHSAMRIEVADAFRACNRDPEVRAVVLTGSGDRAFSAGQDLAEAQAFSPARAEAWMDEWENMYGAIMEMEKAVVAALNGVAAGSAFQVALLCDVRVGHPGVRMGQPEINSGIPSALGPWLMWDMLGRSRTIELTLTGRLMDADECWRLGLIHHLVSAPEVRVRALTVAAELGAKPPVAMRLNKQRFRDMAAAGFKDAEAAGAWMQHEAFATGEPQEMMARFFAARAARKPPAASGRDVKDTHA